MVYCGKPSMGCTTCRDRRIKCDETKPVCKQCIKSRRQCSGYRSNFDILHRDETQTTEIRAKKAAAKKAAKRAADGGGGGVGGGAFIQFEAVQPKPKAKATKLPIVPWDYASSSSSSSSSSATTSPTTSTALTRTANSSTNTSPLSAGFPIAAPGLPLDQHASHYFATHFIMLPGEHSKNGHLDYLVPLLRTETNPSSAFQLAYSACGLGAMSNREKSAATDLVELAYLQHTRALQAVSHALSDPVLCKRDATLAAVLLLIFFENITASKEGGLKAWRSHVEGSTHIVRSRGAEMLQKKYSTRLFSAVRLQIIARTLSSGTAPSMGVNWWTRDADVHDPVGARFQRYCLETSEMRAEVTRLMGILPRHGYGMELMLEMLQKAQSMDRDIANWLAALPAEYQARTLYHETTLQGALHEAPVFPGRVDVYHDLVTAALRNGMRSSRIILASLIIRIAAWVCSPADYRLTPEYRTAVANITANIEEVVSSVPFILSTYNKGHASRLGPNAGSFLCGADQQSKMVGGMTVSWSLSTIRTCDFTTDDQREWTIGRLNYIAYGLGIRYAATLADCQIRFPSMLVRRDGLMASVNPLKEIQGTLAPQTIAVR